MSSESKKLFFSQYPQEPFHYELRFKGLRARQTCNHHDNDVARTKQREVLYFYVHVWGSIQMREWANLLLFARAKIFEGYFQDPAPAVKVNLKLPFFFKRKLNFLRGILNWNPILTMKKISLKIKRSGKSRSKIFHELATFFQHIIFINNWYS